MPRGDHYDYEHSRVKAPLAYPPRSPWRGPAACRIFRVPKVIGKVGIYIFRCPGVALHIALHFLVRDAATIPPPSIGWAQRRHLDGVELRGGETLCGRHQGDRLLCLDSGIPPARFLRERQLVKARREGNVIYYALDDNHVAALFRESDYPADHVRQGLPDHPYR